MRQAARQPASVPLLPCTTVSFAHPLSCCCVFGVSCAALPCRWEILNPASMKQALVEGAVRLPGLNLYEQVRLEGSACAFHPLCVCVCAAGGQSSHVGQPDRQGIAVELAPTLWCCHYHLLCLCALLWLQGQGKLSVVNSKLILERYIPRASLVPRKLNFTGAVRTAHLGGSTVWQIPVVQRVVQALRFRAMQCTLKAPLPASARCPPSRLRLLRPLPRRLPLHVALLPPAAVCGCHAPHVQCHHPKRHEPDGEAGGGAHLDARRRRRPPAGRAGGWSVGWVVGWVGGWVGRCWHQHRRCYVAWQQFGSILAAAGFAFPASGSVP